MGGQKVSGQQFLGRKAPWSARFGFPHNNETLHQERSTPPVLSFDDGDAAFCSIFAERGASPAQLRNLNSRGGLAGGRKGGRGGGGRLTPAFLEVEKHH